MDKHEIKRTVAREVAYLNGQAYWHALQWCIEQEVDAPDDGDTMKLAYNNPERGQRLKLKTGKFVRKWFGVNRTDEDIHRIGSAINARIWGKESVRVLHGEAIREFYRTGPRSCMSGDCSCYLDLYVDNPEKVGLATVVTATGQKARALLWTQDNGEVYLDRIYFTDPVCEKILLDWGSERGYSMYSRGGRTNKVTLSIRNGEASYWPYMDTFSGMTLLSDTECIVSNGGGDYELRCTDGGLEGGGNRCCNCGDYDTDGSVGPDDEFYCEECYSEHWLYCECCESDVASDCINYLESEERYVCDECLRAHYTQCEDCGELERDGDVVTVSGNREVCQSCAENYSLCEECEKWFTSDEGGEVDGHGVYCAECRDTIFWKCEECGDVFLRSEVDDVDGKCADCAMEGMLQC